jgi:hypothetical protein
VKDTTGNSVGITGRNIMKVELAGLIQKIGYSFCLFTLFANHLPEGMGQKGGSSGPLIIQERFQCFSPACWARKQAVS